MRTPFSRPEREATRPTRSPRPIPAFAPSCPGDDIDAARTFIDASVDTMRVLRTDDHEGVRQWLNAVERGAKALHARAIARAVTAARPDIGSDRIVHSIGAVGSLIGQYEQGLVDVEVQMEADARFEEARALLSDLMPDVDTGGHDAALDRLLAFDPRSQAALGVDEDCDVPALAFDVEALLPGLADFAVREARLAGKALTASYAATQARIAANLANEWQEAVELAVVALIDGSLPAHGTQGPAAHMALTAQGREDGLELRITCPGTRTPQFTVDAPHSVRTWCEDGLVCVVFTARSEARNVA